MWFLKGVSQPLPLVTWRASLVCIFRLAIGAIEMYYSSAVCHSFSALSCSFIKIYSWIFQSSWNLVPQVPWFLPEDFISLFNSCRAFLKISFLRTIVWWLSRNHSEYAFLHNSWLSAWTARSCKKKGVVGEDIVLKITWRATYSFTSFWSLVVYQQWNHSLQLRGARFSYPDWICTLW